MALMAALPIAAPFGATSSEAEGPAVGVSLGLVVPADQLLARDDFLGVALRPAPSVGVHLRRSPEDSSGLGWDASLELALLESDSDTRIRVFYLPLEVAGLLGVATVQDVSLQARLAVGGALVSGGLGSVHRTAGVGVTTLGGQVERAIHRLSAVLGVEAGVLWQSTPQPVFQIRLALMSR
jgi:hypothetical protein